MGFWNEVETVGSLDCMRFFWTTSYFCDFKGTMYKFHSIWALLPAVHHFPCYVAFQWSHFKATNLPCLNNFTTFCFFFLICCNYLEVQYSLLNPTIKYNSKKNWSKKISSSFIIQKKKSRIWAKKDPSNFLKYRSSRRFKYYFNKK